jgi:hypothetical protein
MGVSSGLGVFLVSAEATPVPGELLIAASIRFFTLSLLFLVTFGMRDLILLFVHILATSIRLVRPGGVRSVLAESALLKHQLLILNRSRAGHRISGYRTG